MQKAVLILAITIALFGVFFLVTQRNQNAEPEPRTVTVSVPPARSENITVLSPQRNDTIDQPLVVKGEARTFENTVNLRLSQADGTILVEDVTTSTASESGTFGSFIATISYPAPTEGNGKLEVFQYSAKDGSEIDKVTVSVLFPTVRTKPLSVFLSSKTLGGTNCEAVFPVTREVAITTQPARAAIEQLLLGPTTDEQRAGYLSNIPSTVKIKRLAIENGVAKVDFDEALDKNVAGSCRVQAIRSQITQTLLQFETVKEVVISINGKTDDILQP